MLCVDKKMNSFADEALKKNSKNSAASLKESFRYVHIVYIFYSKIVNIYLTLKIIAYLYTTTHYFFQRKDYQIFNK